VAQQSRLPGQAGDDAGWGIQRGRKSVLNDVTVLRVGNAAVSHPAAMRNSENFEQAWNVLRRLFNSDQYFHLHA
jgi:hypothetical protein